MQRTSFGTITELARWLSTALSFRTVFVAFIARWLSTALSQAYPQNGKDLEQWAKERVEALLSPLSNALTPIKTSDRVANDETHVLVQLGMRACVYYLECGIFPEPKTKASDLLKGRELVRQASDATGALLPTERANRDVLM
jgi:hypothetical protein